MPDKLWFAISRALSIPNPDRPRMISERIPGARDLPERIELWTESATHWRLPRGFIFKFEKLANEHDITVEWERKMAMRSGAYQGLRDWEPMELRGYQIDARNEMLDWCSGILMAPTGSGKSRIALEVARWAGQDTLIIVDRTALAKQWQTVIRESYGYEAGMIGDGVWDEQMVTIALRQSLWSRRETIPPAFWNRWGMVLLDECHHASAETLNDLIQRFPAFYRFGLSIGADSIIELKGGLFGSGWVGSIDTATELVADEIEMLSENDYNIWDVVGYGILARGWTGENFGWKPVRKFISHQNNSPLIGIRVAGGKLITTNDHSVYRVGYSTLDVVKADCISIGDRLAVDDGYEWGKDSEIPVDMLDIAGKFHQPQVVVDLSVVSRKELDIDNDMWWRSRNKIINGQRLPLKVYLRNADKLPQPTAVYTSGGRCARPIQPKVLLSNLAYLMGFYLGDGWLDGTRVSLAVDNPRVDEIVNYLRSLPVVNIEPKVSSRGQGSSEVRFGHPFIAEIIRVTTWETKCYDKFIPGEWIISWPIEARRELLRGLLDSDGNIDHRKSSRRYTTTSEQLALTLMSLLRSIGVSPTLSVTSPSNGGFIDGRQIIGKRNKYDVIWSMYAELGDNDGYHGKRSRFEWTKNHLSETAVRKVTTEPSQSTVYDLEMYGHPSFVANGVLVHNSATPVWDKLLFPFIEAAIGPIVHRTLAEEVGDNLIRPSVVVVPTKFEFVFEQTKMRGRYRVQNNYNEMMDALTDDHDRNLQIANIAADEITNGHHVLITTRRVEHAKVLFHLFDGWVSDRIFLLTGKESKRYEMVRTAIASATEGTLLISTIADEALDIPRLDRLIMAFPARRVALVEQQIGRIRRPAEGKTDAIVYDIYDEKIGVVKGQHRDRQQQLYLKRKWPVRTLGVDVI